MAITDLGHMGSVMTISIEREISEPWIPTEFVPFIARVRELLDDSKCQKLKINTFERKIFCYLEEFCFC